MKLTKEESKMHGQACDLLAKDVLTYEDKEFVLSHWHEGAENDQTKHSAFFTPAIIAGGLACMVGYDGGGITDLCAGIGRLAYTTLPTWRELPGPVICVEPNASFCAVGKKILPGAFWYNMTHEEYTAGPFLQRTRWAISNPPFGSGREYHMIESAARCATFGAFILPVSVLPYTYSGQQSYQKQANAKYERWSAKTGLVLEPTSVDTSYRDSDEPGDWWRGVAPRVEIVTVDFEGVKA